MTGVQTCALPIFDLEAVRKGQEELHQRREIQLGQFFSLNDQCRVQPPPSVEVVKKPRYGTIVVREGQGVVMAVFAKNRQHCIGTKGALRSPYYVLDEKHRDRTDTDTITLRSRHSNGVTDIVDYEIDLGQRTSTRTKFARQQ